jgi:glycerol kinase
MAGLILALDQGTTSSRALVFDADGDVLGTGQYSLSVRFPHPGWVEQDPADLWTTQRDAAVAALQQAGVDAADVAAIGIANQRETVMLWERASGTPLGPAIVWQDRRTAAVTDALKADGREAWLRERTGLVADPYFSATKLAWLLGHLPEARARAQRGELAAGTVDTWLVWNLTGGAVHATEPSNASRTLLYDLYRRDWSDELLALFDIPRALLPEIRPSGGDFGTTDLFGAPVRIAAVLGDQQAATFGQGCHAPGTAKCTYGTGAFVVAHTGATPPAAPDGLLGTVGWQLAGEWAYACEGSILAAGAALDWARETLALAADPGALQALAASVPDSGGVVFVPAIAGLGAPHWQPHARGALLGLTRGTTSAHIARAAYEGVALRVTDVLDTLAAAVHAPTVLRADGGLARSDLLLQLQADLAGIPVERPRCVETTAFGAAAMAGVVAGVWPDGASAAACNPPERRFEPTGSDDRRAELQARWRAALAGIRAAAAA